MEVGGFLNLSIIIVNWHSCDYLDRCLASLSPAGSTLDYDVIVVDNASYDGSEAMIRKKYHSVKYLQSDINGGFAYANNLGARKSRGEVLLFLNPDTEVNPDTIDLVYQELMIRNEAGIATCVLLNTDGSVQTSCVRSFPTIINQVLDFEFLRKLFTKSSLSGSAALFMETTDVFKVEAVSGAFLMIKRSVFEQVGGFNEDYFMYSEDVDLCYQASKVGCDVLLVKRTKTVHHGGGSTGDETGNRFSSVMMRESRYQYFKINKGISYAVLYRGSMILSSLARLGVLSVIYIFKLAIRKQPRYGAFAKWTYILMWSLGGERWRRKYRGCA